MKKQLLTLLLISISVISFAQNSTGILKAKAAAKAYIIKNLNNPGSYKPAAWGRLEKYYNSFSDTKRGQTLQNTLEKLHKNRLYSEDPNVRDSSEKDYDSLYKVQSHEEKLFKPTFSGYTIEHSFRAKNKFNALVLQKYIFVMSKTFRVESASDVEENERERQDLERSIDEFTGGN